jgi:hypothetical protein
MVCLDYPKSKVIPECGCEIKSMPIFNKNAEGGV